MAEPDLAALKRAPLYSEELGIDLAHGGEGALFRWFLASLLFGQRIAETIVCHTFESFARHRLTTPQRILDAGWDFLVNPVMREGGYVRYDESESRRLLADCRRLIDEYGGHVTRLHDAARDADDLQARLFDQDHFITHTLGLRIGGFGYSTDVVALDEAAFAALAGVDTWVVGCFQRTPHRTHASLDRVLDWAARVRARRTELTHMGGDLDWDWMRCNLPAGVEAGYDGQVLECPAAEP